MTCVTAFLVDEALLSISPADHGQLGKMLVSLEPHGIFGSNCILNYIKSVQPLECKTVAWLLGEFKSRTLPISQNLF